jgi:demethylmenaquinone methyltransferase / 2-methoxy-6-polyprenyl-1,4-benzoquinol methylase
MKGALPHSASGSVPHSASGAVPQGVNSEVEAARWVRGMFGRIAPRYDLANHLLSFNIDKRWRNHTVRRLKPDLENPGARVLDLCCGTGDLALALERGRRGSVFASDFCHPMLTAASAKTARDAARIALFEADSLRLPVADGSFDVVTVAFGFRNLANYHAGLAEMRRILRTGGVAAILEFTDPPNPVFAALYRFYSHRILPWIGGAVSGSRDAYTYLPESVRRFPKAKDLAETMVRSGFRDVSYEYLTGGIVALHRGRV